MIEVRHEPVLETIPYNWKTENVNNIDSGETAKEEVGKNPLMYINGVQIENQNIKKLKLINNNIFPSIEITFIDTSSELLKNDKFPADNIIVSIYKKATLSLLRDIKMDFKIINFQTIKGEDNQLLFKLKGILNVDELYLSNFESYKGSSYDTLELLSKEMKIGFASNIISTDDSMAWINPGNYRQDFIKSIINNSYIDETTFLIGYIDFFYIFNYVDIDKQLTEDISTQENAGDSEQMGKGIESEPEPLPTILSNNKDTKTENLFIDKYTVFNKSTYVNIESGYRSMFTTYKKTENNIKRFLLDSFSEDDGNSVVLKGNPDNDNDILYNESIKEIWMGKSDSYNVHDNYLKTSLQNQNNLKYLQKLKIVVKLKKPNYSFYRFQKILLELYNYSNMEETDKVENKLGEPGENDTKLIDNLSGEWLITAINIEFSTKEGNIQEITLVKREFTEKYNYPRKEK